MPTTSVRRCVSEHRPGRAHAVRGLDHAAPAGPSGSARAGTTVGRHQGYGRAPRAWPGEVHGSTGQGCPVKRGLRGARHSVPERRASLVADELGGREPQLHGVCDPHRGRAARRGYADVAAGVAAGRGPLDLEAAAADGEGDLSACAGRGDALGPRRRHRGREEAGRWGGAHRGPGGAAVVRQWPARGRARGADRFPGGCCGVRGVGGSPLKRLRLMAKATYLRAPVGDALDPQTTTQVAATVRTVLPDLLYSLLTEAWLRKAPKPVAAEPAFRLLTDAVAARSKSIRTSAAREVCGS